MAATVPECRQHGQMVLRPVESMTPEQRYCGTWYDCPICLSSVLIPSAESLAFIQAQRDIPGFCSLADRILSAMRPGRWYLPHEVKRLAGIDRSHPQYNGLLSRMCEAGLLIHGNGTTTRGFCRPT